MPETEPADPFHEISEKENHTFVLPLRGWDIFLFTNGIRLARKEGSLKRSKKVNIVSLQKFGGIEVFSLSLQKKSQLVEAREIATYFLRFSKTYIKA